MNAAFIYSEGGDGSLCAAIGIRALAGASETPYRFA